MSRATVTRAFSYFRTSGERDREGSNISRRTSRGGTTVAGASHTESPGASAVNLPGKIDVVGGSSVKNDLNGDARAHSQEAGDGSKQQEAATREDTTATANRGRTDVPTTSSAAAQDALAAISSSTSSEAKDKSLKLGGTASSKAGSAAISRNVSNATYKPENKSKSKSSGQSPPSPIVAARHPSSADSIVDAERLWHERLEGHERELAEAMRTSRLAWREDTTRRWQQHIDQEKDRAAIEKAAAARTIEAMSTAAGEAVAERMASERKWQARFESQERQTKEMMETARREWAQEMERREHQSAVERETSDRKWQERLEERERAAAADKAEADRKIETLMVEMKRTAAERAEAERRWQQLLKATSGSAGIASGSRASK